MGSKPERKRSPYVRHQNREGEAVKKQREDVVATAEKMMTAVNDITQQPGWSYLIGHWLQPICSSEDCARAESVLWFWAAANDEDGRFESWGLETFAETMGMLAEMSADSPPCDHPLYPRCGCDG